MNANSLFGHVLKNLRVFHEFRKCGFDYIVNPVTGELHRAAGGTLFGAHNLAFADLENFIGLANLESIPIHRNFDGTLIPIYDLTTGELIGEYPLNKCRHCFPNLK